MGALLSRWFGAKVDDDFEQILSDLEDKVYRTEIAIGETKLRERRYVALVTTYSLLLYIIWTVAFFFTTWPHVSLDRGLAFVVKKVCPLVLVPVFIFLLRSAFRHYFRHSLQLQEQNLDTYRKQKKQKVEELKKKTKYYESKNLIERYDGSPMRKAVPSSQAAKGPSPLVTRAHPSSTPAPAVGASAQSQSSPALLPPSHAQAYQETQRSAARSMPPIQPYERTWVDRVLDMVIGEEAPTSKYALICQQCFSHNGLASPADFDSIQYRCVKCGFFNSRRKAHGDDHHSEAGGSPARGGSSLADTASERAESPVSHSPIRESDALRESLIAAGDDDADCDANIKINETEVTARGKTV